MPKPVPPEAPVLVNAVKPEEKLPESALMGSAVESFEQSLRYLSLYYENLIGLVTDLQFPSGRELHPRAGLVLSQAARCLRPTLPIIIHTIITSFCGTITIWICRLAAISCPITIIIETIGTGIRTSTGIIFTSCDR